MPQRGRPVRGRPQARPRLGAGPVFSSTLSAACISRFYRDTWRRSFSNNLLSSLNVSDRTRSSILSSCSAIRWAASPIESAVATSMLSNRAALLSNSAPASVCFFAASAEKTG